MCRIGSDEDFARRTTRDIYVQTFVDIPKVKARVKKKKKKSGFEDRNKNGNKNGVLSGWYDC